MTKMTRSLFAATTFFLLALAGSRASAQTCGADTDCPQGFVCVVSGTSTAPACKGPDCPADAGAGDPIVYKACQPKDCATDADCGTGMVCYAQKSTACTGGGGSVSGCAANTQCDAAVVVTTTETCTTTTRNICAFKWQLPCSADTDCGDGFVCQPNVSSCGSSSSVGASAPADPTSPPPSFDAGAPECPTVAAFPGWCSPKSATCAANSDCPGGWTCTTIGTPEPVRGVGASTPVGGPEPADAVDAGGATTKICVGPFGEGAPTRGIDVGTTGDASNTGHQGTDPGAPSPQAPGGATGGTTGAATGGTTGGASASSGTAGGGCAIAPARSGGSALLAMGLEVVGLVLARRRRRQ